MFSTLRVLLVVAAAVSAARSACPSEWKQYETMCYWASDFELTWMDAAEVCPALFPGATLASIHDADLDAFIGEDVLGGIRAWIGLRCADGTASSCTWTDGTPYDYHSWYESTTPIGSACSSGECCAYINAYDNYGDWNGLGCYNNYQYFVCQVDAS